MASPLSICKGGWETILFVNLPCAPLQTGSSVTEELGKEHWSQLVISNRQQAEMKT